jgi:hypothetical protein
MPPTVFGLDLKREEGLRLPSSAHAHAWDAQMVSPGVYGTHGSKRPGDSR